jgi:hypothetical protein
VDRKIKKAKTLERTYDEKWDVDDPAAWHRLPLPGRPAASRKRGNAKVPDWFLWSLVLIGLMLAVLVVLVLKFLRNDEGRNGDDGGDR